MSSQPASIPSVILAVCAATAAPLAAASPDAASPSADVPVETAAAFDRYLRATDARVDAELADPSRFLWFDFASDARRREVAARLGDGQPLLERLTTTERGTAIPIPGGIVHHWVGVVFVPGVRVAAAVALMQDYDRHGDVFAPSVSRGRVVARDGDTIDFTMRFVVKKVITAVLQTDQQARFFRPAPDRAHSRIRATRIVEIENAGTPQEREKPPDRDRGYMWRLASYWRFIERDGGTYIQCESLNLSRPLPAMVGWFFGRSAAAIPRDTLSFTLSAARRELLRR